MRCDDREWRSFLSFFSVVPPAVRDRGDGVRLAGEVRGELRGLGMRPQRCFGSYDCLKGEGGRVVV